MKFVQKLNLTTPPLTTIKWESITNINISRYHYVMHYNNNLGYFKRLLRSHPGTYRQVQLSSNFRQILSVRLLSVNYFHEKLYFRLLTEFWIRVCNVLSSYCDGKITDVFPLQAKAK